MSWAATSWAKAEGRRAGLATLPRFLLIMVADRTNDDTHYTFASPRILAEDCGCSADSVKDWLRKFEAMGLLARVKRLKANGASDTSLLILLTGEAARAKAAELGWTAPVEGAEEAGDGTDDGAADPQDVVGEGGMAPPYPGEGEGGMAPPRGGNGSPPSKDEPEKGTYTPKPQDPVGETGRTPALAVVPKVELTDLHPDEAGAHAFLQAWPIKTTADVPEVIRRLWRGLSVSERRLAADRLDLWRRQKEREKRSLGTATAYLRNKSWQVLDVISAGRRDGTAAATFWVLKGSPEWEAWSAYQQRTGGQRMVAYTSRWDRGEGRHMPSLWPPKMTAPAGADDDATVARHLGA